GDTATPGSSSLSLHDALPICQWRAQQASTSDNTAPHFTSEDRCRQINQRVISGQYSTMQDTPVTAPHRSQGRAYGGQSQQQRDRSEEHTSELQSRENLVCRLL